MAACVSWVRVQLAVPWLAILHDACDTTHATQAAAPPRHPSTPSARARGAARTIRAAVVVVAAAAGVLLLLLLLVALVVVAVFVCRAAARPGRSRRGRLDRGAPFAAAIA